MSLRPRRPAAVAVLAVLALLGVLAILADRATPARAAPPDGPPTLVPQRLPAWVKVGTRYDARIRVSGAGARALRFTLHVPVTTMVRFSNIARNEPDALGAVIDDPIKLRLDRVKRAANGDYLPSFPLQDPNGHGYTQAQLLAMMRINAPGVYPLEVFLLGADDQQLDRIVTWIVATDGARTQHPLQLGWIWTVRAAPLIGPDGEPSPTTRAEIAPKGRLDRRLTAMDAAGPMPSTLRLTPELAQSWAVLALKDPTLAAGAADVAAHAQRAQVLGEPYVQLDRVAVEQAGLGPLLPAQVVAGRNSLQRLVGRRIDTRTAFVDALDRPSLSRLEGGLTDRLVLRSASVSPVDSALRYGPFRIRGASLVAAQTDDDLAALLEGAAPPALRAQQLLAALGLLQLQTPDTTRGVLIAPDDTFTDAAVVRFVAAGLRDHPLLRPTTLDGWFAAVPLTVDVGQSPVVRDLLARPVAPLAVTRSQYDDASRALTDLGELVGTQDASVARGARALRTAVGVGVTARVAQRGLDAISGAAHDFLARITPRERTVTLTARRGDVPLSFSNPTGRAVRLRVTLRSDRLVSPDGSDAVSREFTLPAQPPTSTVGFPVETRVAGRFRIAVTLSSADGSITGGPAATITVNSTGFGSAGTWLTYGALGFLGLWWIHHIWRVRRAGPPPPSAAVPS